MSKKILLIDGNSLIFRAYFASAYRGVILKTTAGIPTNAVFSFANMLTSLLLKDNYYDVKVAFDKGKKTFRHAKLEDYKSGRSQTPIELIEQFPIVREMLDSVGIDWFELEGYEADDIIGAIDKYIEKNLDEYSVDILTSDKDMFQLISEKTKILIPVSGTSELIEFGKNELKEKWNIEPNQVIELKGLMGDSSDNLKGVAGVGEKTAIKLICDYSNLEGVYNSIDSIKGALKNKLIEGKDSAFLCREIATIETEIPIDGLDFRKLNIKNNEFSKFLQKYEMYSLVNRMKNRVELINNEEKHNFQILEKWDHKLEDEKNFIFVETINDNYHRGKICGIAISNKKGNFFLNFKTQNVQLTFFDDSEIKKEDPILNEFLNDLNVKKYTYDIKKTVTLLNNNNLKANYDSFVYDMMIAAYIFDPNISSTFENHLRLVSNKYNIESDEFIFGKGVKRTDNIEINIKAEYISKKAYYISKTYNSIIEKLKINNQIDLYNNIDLPFTKVLFEMEQNGVLIDKKELNIQTQDILNKINKLDDEMRNLLGNQIDKNFNFSSPKQVQKLLFEDLKLTDLQKGSTGKEVLEKLQNDHPLISMLIRHRKLSKLYSTYLKGFEKYIFEDNKVHTIFNQTLTNTGRLSSIEPNLQNISVHDQDQKEVRKIFITNKDSLFYSFDYSQIELRVLAQMAPEKNLLDVFKVNGDVHENAARKIFNLSNDSKIEPEMRRIAKIFNFGIIYGLSDFGLANDLNISIPEAKIYINNYYKSYPDIKLFKEKMVLMGKDNGYVLTMAKRKRNIPELKSLNYQLRQFGERVAINMPIQGTAADILKVAMIEIQKEIYLKKYNSKMVAQIHDEIIFEINKKEEKFLVSLIENKMKDALNQMMKITNNNEKLLIDLKVSKSSGINWFELK